MRKYEIKVHVIEAKKYNLNPVEGLIREPRMRWLRMMIQTYWPRALWNYGIPYIAIITEIKASFASNLQGRKPLEALTSDTPDISQFLDFGFYDRVWFREDAVLGETKLGRFIGFSHSVGSLMSYWVLPSSGITTTQTNLQKGTNLEE